MAYIDCEKCCHGKVCSYRHIYHNMVVACEHWMPTADVVEVVRCKDCKYFTIDDGDILGVCDCARIARNNGGEIYPVEDHFCSYGKRKESNDYD